MKTKLLSFWNLTKELMPMLLFMVVYLLGFSLVEKVTRVHFTEIHLMVDDLIPFCEWFVIPYYLWFGFVAFSVGYLYLKDREIYDKTATLLYIGMSLFLVISVIFPNIQYLRPMMMPRQNILTALVARLYATDTNTNVFPSIHVYNTLVCMTGLANAKAPLAKKQWFRAATGILGWSIILSTMFLKQHSVVDVLGAFALFAPMYLLVYNFDVVIESSGAFAR